MYRFAFAMFCAAFVSTAVAAPCAGFTDVDDSSGFCVNVEWMKNRGITLGITQTLYGPNAPVTRLQMAAFMYRLGFQNAFLRGGNAFDTTAVLGTTDNEALELHVDGRRAMRFQPYPGGAANIIGGHSANIIDLPILGNVIAGGGDAGQCSNNSGGQRPCANHITEGSHSAIGGGLANLVSGPYATIAGGVFNTANFGATVSGGHANEGNGVLATVPGGADNAANGAYSFAAGRRAKATTNGSFIWADSKDFDFQPSVANFFGVRATGGAGITVAINETTGAVTQFCNLLPGVAGWQCTSDRNEKENLQVVVGDAVLEKVATLPIFEWSFKGADPAIRNLGPTAQDFHLAFGLGNDEKSIASNNLHGVALAAIQGLNAKLEAEVVALRSELAAIRSLLSQR